ncbi:toll/interleukin-1 receptor domain-containing protein [Chryseobacterium paludis]|uniref:toll/interleukin-1 receptor domain-containing protein n=1 Tax=Chryseobacterium paludis TaxID=2956784 RepID=UPI0021C15D04|nr:toll/interleukin-1 receptor domain-containing protein [Chryseobacterium paludis]
MEKLISKDLLAKVRSENLNEFIQLNTKAEDKRKRNKYSFETSVFLSHKHDEKEIIKQVITLLNKLGIDVYVDWLDNEMPKNTNGSTATRIKEKIKQNDKFILLATEAAISSKWCNWELGYGDAHKYHKNIAVMPITNNNDNVFSGTEYLQIYPIITSEFFTFTGTYWVEYNETKIKLVDWLKQ